MATAHSSIFSHLFSDFQKLALPLTRIYSLRKLYRTNTHAHNTERIHKPMLRLTHPHVRLAAQRTTRAELRKDFVENRFPVNEWTASREQHRCPLHRRVLVRVTRTLSQKKKTPAYTHSFTHTPLYIRARVCVCASSISNIKNLPNQVLNTRRT